MGLDITLGIVVLIGAIRGWFKGFLRQVIPLGALVGCVYAADPVRDLARPYAASYFPSIGGEILDRLLWWTAAALLYVLMTGVSLSILKSMRRRTYGEPEPNRADQGAGFTLGAIKGLILASFLAAAVTKYGPPYLSTAPFADEQAKTSKAMAWSLQYCPAEKLWVSPPVQSFVSRVKSRGVWSAGETKSLEKKIDEKPSGTETAKPSATADTPIRTASGRPKTLSVPRRLDPGSPSFLEELENEMRHEGLDPDRP
ncbi:MAG: putative rane protein required for colicin production [Planctomycetota bacterium]|nr:putative rane protein required for colicin production [Planctomycetota bacterium]